jgi:apolipoprotein N-acyltransferase
MMQAKIPIRHSFFALTSGFLLTCAFPKIGLEWLAWIALIPLLAALRHRSPKEGFVLGLIAGAAHYLTLLYWLVPTMKNYGYLPWFLCAAILILFSLYLSIFTAVFSAGLVRLSRTPVSCFLMIPIFWVSMDYLRSFLFTGFPWAFIGYTQHRHLHLIQISDLFGVYGVSFWIAAVNGLVLLLLLHVLKLAWHGERVTRRFLSGSLAAVCVLSCMAWWYGDRRIAEIDRLAAGAVSVPVAIVQGNIDQEKKWDQAFQRETIDIYLRLSLSAKSPKPDLVVWPETATPFYLGRDKRLTKMVIGGIRQAQTDFLIGSPSYEKRHDVVEYYNSAFLIGSKGDPMGRYDKVHLVPFGEYVPFKQWVPFFGKIVAHVGDFWPGEKGQTVVWDEFRLGVQICYEIIFPHLSRGLVKNGADLLINITNDAWYGDTSAPYQHFSMTVFRAVENRRCLIRSANTGISGFVDPVGRVVASSPLFKESVITSPTPMLTHKTVYTRFGDVFALGCLGVVLTVGVIRQRKKIGSNKVKETR